MNATKALTMGRLTIAVLVFFSAGNQVWAQEEHAHESPHGGEIRTMGDYHVEFLVVEGENDKSYIVVYLLDKNQKPVPVDGAEGVVYVTLPDKSKKTLKLAISTDMIISDHHDEEGEHEEDAGQEHHGEGDEHEKAEGHEDGKEDVSHFQAEVNLKGIATFNAVVSLKIGDKRNNLRFKYVRGDHDHDH